MLTKNLKFKPHLAKLIREGKKTTTWRFFDEKNIEEGDELALFENGVDEPFAKAIATKVVEKPLSSLTEDDWVGHERFANDEEMYATYRKYYGPSIDKETLVKIIWFETKKFNNSPRKPL